MTLYERALCVGSVDLFTAERLPLSETARAVKTCLACHHIDECAELGRDQRFGVWGGTTSQQRGFYKSGRRAVVQS